MDFSEIFLASDQPTNCPKCGNRTEFQSISITLQRHSCIFEKCNFEFILEFDVEEFK